MIITRNVREFPVPELQPHGIEAQTPDEFIRHLIDLYPWEVLHAAEEHRTNLKNPPKTVQEHLAALRKQGLAETVMALIALYSQK